LNEAKDRVDLLIVLLKDRGAPIESRDDAAIDLGTFDDPRALAALLEVGADPREDEMIVGSCGESIGEMVVRTGVFDPRWTARLAPAASHELRSRLQGERPELLKGESAGPG
jgi:HEAT repeat protein